MVDRRANDEIQRALGNAQPTLAGSDLVALVTMAEKALARMRDPSFRRWPGRLASLDWCQAYEGTLSTFVDVARSGGETLGQLLNAVGTPLIAGYATPFFQSDYALAVRGGAWADWVSTRKLTEDRTRVRLFRLIKQSSPELEVRVEVAEPCSFVSLGYLDGGILREIVARDRPALERLLSGAEQVRHGYADLNWVAPEGWLSELASIVRRHARAGAERWVEHLELLKHEAGTRHHDISIGGWYGHSSALMPVAWQRI